MVIVPWQKPSSEMIDERERANASDLIPLGLFEISSRLAEKDILSFETIQPQKLPLNQNERNTSHLTNRNRITRVEELVYELSVSGVMTKTPLLLTSIPVLRRSRSDAPTKISGAPVMVDQILTGIITLKTLFASVMDELIKMFANI